MATQYLIDIGINDELPDVIRKCNYNFRLTTRRQNNADVSMSTITEESIAGITQAIAGETESREQADRDINERIDDIEDRIETVSANDNTPIGTIIDFAGSNFPTGYLECDGSAISRDDYDALFTVINTTWGAGDGSTTFNLPSLNGRTDMLNNSTTVLIRATM